MQGALLINLDRSPDRLVRCEPLLAQLGVTWERVTGIEGAKLPAERLASLNPFPAPHGEWYRPLTPGEIGCFLSHQACWQRIIDLGWSCGLVLEDDFAMADGFSPERLAALMATSDQWDVVKLTRLGTNAPLHLTLPQGLRLRGRGAGPIDGTAYLVSARGARKMVAQREHIWRPVDFDMKHHWERDLTLHWCDPDLFRQVSHEEAPSVIGDRSGHRRLPLAQKAQVYLRKYRYHIDFFLADQLHIGRRSVLGPR